MASVSEPHVVAILRSLPLTFHFFCCPRPTFSTLSLPVPLLTQQVIDSFGPTTTPDELVDEVAGTSLYIVYLACGAAVTSYFQVACFTLSAQRQSLRIRQMYFKSLVRQEMSWYDQHKTGALSSRISSDVPQIQEALGDKVGSFLQFLGMFFGTSSINPGAAAGGQSRDGRRLLGSTSGKEGGGAIERK